MRLSLSKICWGFCLITASMMASCAPGYGGGSRPVQKANHVMYQWYDDGGPGEIAINIRLSEQKAFIQRGGRDVGWTYVATGKEGHGTSLGRYCITEKIVDKYSN